MQLTKLQIIEDMVEYYSADPTRRGIGINGACVYLSEAGNMCGVGRHMNEPLKTMRGACDNLYLKDSPTAVTILDSVLKDESKGHSSGFWRHIQMFHDAHHYWKSDGLTAAGVSALVVLKRSWGGTA